MKKIVINSDNRRFNISSIVVGYLEENKEEVLEFEIPEKYAEYGKKACFSANGQTFAKNFDDIISNKLTITRDISQFKELDMTIEFFKIENEDEVVARTSILHILIENAIICDDYIKPDEPKIIILDNLIDEVTKLDVLVTKNEKKREEYYQEIQKKVDNGDLNGATFTPSVDVDGNISWTNDKNLPNPTIQNIKGPKGEKGDTYNLTEKDKQDISDMTVESSESTFNQYYNGKLEDFNNNATSKTNDYNTNATNKTTEYNNNAISKVNEFNTNTDAKLQEYNTNADNKIAEYDLHSQELDNKIIATRNELERVKNDVLETGTDTDTFVHLEDSAMAEYQELSVDGVCEQKTTSIANGDEYDSPSPEFPQPISTIENSLKITSCNKNLLGLIDGTYTHNGITAVVDNGKITLNGTAESTSFIAVPLVNKINIGNQKITISLNNLEIIEDSLTEMRVYTSGSVYLPCAFTTINNSVTYTNKTGTYARLQIRTSSGITYNNFVLYPQLEKGPTATPYEQHLETQITANLPDGEFIGKINKTYKDTLKVEYNEDDGQYHLMLNKMINRTVITSDNVNSFGMLINKNQVVPALSISKSKLGLAVTWETGRALVNRYKEITSTSDVKSGTFATNFQMAHLWLFDDRFTDLEIAKSLVIGTEIYNVLANPYVVDLGIVDMPITYNEITNLFTDSDLMPQINAKYYRNFISTIQNLQVNEKALKQELIDINNRLSALETAQTNVASESEVVE